MNRIKEKIIEYRWLILFGTVVILTSALFSYHIATSFMLITTGGDSMEPLYDDNSTVLYKAIDSVDEINEGDVISFHSQCPVTSDTIGHTVVETTEKGLITQGENNNVTDQARYENGTVTEGSCEPKVTDKNIRGKKVMHTSNDNISTTIQSIRNKAW